MESLTPYHAIEILGRCAPLVHLHELPNSTGMVPLIIKDPQTGKPKGVSTLSSKWNWARMFAHCTPEFQKELLAMSSEQIDAEFAEIPAHDREGLKVFLNSTRTLRNAVNKAHSEAPPKAETIRKLTLRKRTLADLGIHVETLHAVEGLVIEDKPTTGIVMDQKVLEAVAGISYEEARQRYRDEFRDQGLS